VGKSVKAAAALAGCSKRTAFRRLSNPDFKKQLAAARQAMLDRSIGHLAAGSTEAAIVLRNLLRAGDQRIKLGSARALLTLGMQIREHEDLARQVAELQQIVNRQLGSKRREPAREA
jgi:hypothetical protein